VTEAEPLEAEPLTIDPNGWLDFDWGDGTAIDSVRPPTVSATHQYATNGAKTITVRATRADHSTEVGRGTGDYTVAPATLTQVVPPSGLAGIDVGIQGTGLTGTTMVYFAAAQATNVVITNDGTLRCTVPPGTGLVNVNAFVRGVATNPAQFQYLDAEEEAEAGPPEPEAASAPAPRSRSRARGR
jgi:hypothetical protein